MVKTNYYKCFNCNKEHSSPFTQFGLSAIKARCLKCGSYNFVELSTLKVFSTTQTKLPPRPSSKPYIGWHHNAKVIYGGKS